MTYDPETYWPARHQRQGPFYVAPGGREKLSRPQVEAIVPYFRHLPTEGRVLDFGCGPGRFRGALEGRGLEYEGVDLIPGLGTMDATDVEPGSFDAAVAILVLQHIVDPGHYREAVGLLNRCLRPGGRLLVVDHEADRPPAEFDDHMSPLGFGELHDFWRWSDAQRVGEMDGHWIGVFTK